jgi:hypothetical protein
MKEDDTQYVKSMTSEVLRVISENDSENLVSDRYAPIANCCGPPVEVLRTVNGEIALARCEPLFSQMGSQHIRIDYSIANRHRLHHETVRTAHGEVALTRYEF